MPERSASLCLLLVPSIDLHLQARAGALRHALVWRGGHGRRAPRRIRQGKVIFDADLQTEAIMPEHISIHSFLDWTKRRIDEMDAVLASLEAKASLMKADLKTKADQLITDLKKRRDSFQSKASADARAEAGLEAAKAQLELEWNGFEAQVRAYFETVGKSVEQQQATFRDVAAAQAKAWGAATDKLHAEATKVAAARRADIDSALKQMKADAAEADARLQKVKRAGGESWTALSAALTESRKAFDRASQRAWGAFKRAVPPNS
jgi:hypothetical protein